MYPASEGTYVEKPVEIKFAANKIITTKVEKSANSNKKNSKTSSFFLFFNSFFTIFKALLEDGLPLLFI